MDEKKNILLVGANGYIASRFLDREGDKFETTNIDNLQKPGVLTKNIEKRVYRDLDKGYLKNDAGTEDAYNDANVSVHGHVHIILGQHNFSYHHSAN